MFPSAEVTARFVKFSESRWCVVHRDATESVAVVEQQDPNVASQSRVAFSSIAWNTGSSSPCDG